MILFLRSHKIDVSRIQMFPCCNILLLIHWHNDNGYQMRNRVPTSCSTLWFYLTLFPRLRSWQAPSCDSFACFIGLFMLGVTYWRLTVHSCRCISAYLLFNYWTRVLLKPSDKQALKLQLICRISERFESWKCLFCKRRSQFYLIFKKSFPYHAVNILCPNATPIIGKRSKINFKENWSGQILLKVLTRDKRIQGFDD